ncbi:hypothetical protein [uncultured Aquimarina sp.]|uniref:hypothetical protein n=1 Tax=uncultured Aquimarina sp. TaxID=575652 RepID=UPI0026289EA4|nr:hypothetical protein [uncultured Aquimarina sp.]
MNKLRKLNGVKTISKSNQQAINGGFGCPICPAGTCSQLDFFTGKHVACVPC